MTSSSGTKMDRLGRNTADMIRIVDTCYKKRHRYPISREWS